MAKDPEPAEDLRAADDAVGDSRREFLRKMVAGTAFAAPVVSSFTMAGILAACEPPKKGPSKHEPPRSTTTTSPNQTTTTSPNQTNTTSRNQTNTTSRNQTTTTTSPNQTSTTMSPNQTTMTMSPNQTTMTMSPNQTTMTMSPNQGP